MKNDSLYVPVTVTQVHSLKNNRKSSCIDRLVSRQHRLWWISIELATICSTVFQFSPQLCFAPDIFLQQNDLTWDVLEHCIVPFASPFALYSQQSCSVLGLHESYMLSEMDSIGIVAA